MLRTLDDAFGVHANRHIDDDAKSTARAQHGREQLVSSGEHADLTGRGHHRQRDHTLPQQPKPAREIAAQTTIDDVANDTDIRPGPNRQRTLPVPDGLHEFLEDNTGAHRHQQALSVLMELDRLQLNHVQDHGVGAGKRSHIRGFVTSPDARDRCGDGQRADQAGDLLGGLRTADLTRDVCLAQRTVAVRR